MKKIKKRIIAIICVVCMTCTLCSDVIPALASDDTAITLENAPEAQFDSWTFSDVGLDDQTITSDKFNWTSPSADAKSMNETIFHGEILFPAGSGDDFGRLFIGGSATENSKDNGFLIRGHGTDSISLLFQNEGVEPPTQIKNFYSSTAGVNIRGNEKLHFSLSVQVLSEQDGIATVKLGVFFNGKLYNNEYYTVSGIPTSALTQHVRMRYAANNPKIASIITIDNAPEADFDAWTFRNAGLQDNPAFSSSVNWNEFATEAEGAALNKTLFQGKINFDDVSSFGLFVIGGNYATEASKNRGFRFESYGTTDSIALGFWGPDGYFYNENGNTGTQQVTEASQIAIFEPEVAETTLRGNSELLLSLSVEYISEVTDGKVDIKVGVFFDGKLYDNTYYTVKGVPEAFLRQNVRFNLASAVSGVSNAIASYPPVSQEPKEDITLETAPEKDFAAWTFRDVEIDDQTVKTDLNWGSDWEYRTAGDSLHQTLFQGKINFANGEGDAADFYIGGADATDDETATTSKYGGFIFQTVGTDGLKLGYRVSGTNTIHPIAEFDSTTAETQLRGNEELLLAFSVEYLSVENENATVKLGVFFDGNLYDDTYYTIENIPTKYMNQNIRLKAVQKNNVVASYPTEVPGSAQDIYLANTPEKDFACWTFEDLGIDDQYLSVHLNWGDNWKEQSISNSLDKTIFNGLINFPADTDNFGNFYLGGASENDDSKWRGFVFLANGTTDKLSFGFQGTEGSFFGKYGNTGSGAMSGLLATFDPEVAGVTLRGNSNLQLSLSVEYTAVTETTADLKVGVFFNGKLYNGEYFTLKDVPLEYLNQNIRFYAVGPNNEIASQHLCSKGNSNNIPSTGKYEELTLHDFSILDRYARTIEEGKDFRAENYCDWETLDGTAVSVVCNFPENGSGRFSVGGSFWRGVYVGSRTDGRVEVCYVNAAGEMKRLAFLDAETAGVKTLTGRDVTFRLTFDIEETSDTLCDLKLGVYVNGKLYNDKHYTVRNAEIETLTRTFKVYATNAPFTVKSVVTQPDLSVYGFDNKTWKSKI